MARVSRTRANVHMHREDGLALLSMSLCGDGIGYLSVIGELDLLEAKALLAQLEATIAEMEDRLRERLGAGATP
jgi:hypothetical protein